jgi:pyruvate kinase
MSIITHIDLLKKRRTRIIATIGPASSSPEIIENLIQAGVNVFRLNMSHGDHAGHRAVYTHIRSIAGRLNLPVGILADLCGPKIRTGTFTDGGIRIETGSRITVTTRDVTGKPGLIPSQYAALAEDVKPGDSILLSDGAMELKVEAVSGTEICCTVIHGGEIKDHQGINLPGIRVSAPSLTEKDRKDAFFALELGVDFLALSFVRQARDIMELKALVETTGRATAIVAKIEKPEALDVADEILDAADAIMIARGDLGVELRPEQVPVAQSQLIDLARLKCKPVIVATQMLESMIDNARPTRAEVTDIAYAVTLGADAVMLSAETAAGAYPVPAVSMMDRIARQTESYLWKTGVYGTTVDIEKQAPVSVWPVIANAVSHMSKSLMAHAVLVISQSGTSATIMSSGRPAAPIVAIAPDAEVYRRMSLLWGVIPILDPRSGESDPVALARSVAMELGLAGKGDYILLIRGFSNDESLNTPSITTITV